MIYLTSLIIAVFLAACIVLLSWGISFVPQPYNEMARDARGFTFLAVLVWIVRRGSVDRQELKEHRREIADTLNHRLADLEQLKKTAEALQQHNDKLAAVLAAMTKERADKTDLKLDQIIHDKETAREVTATATAERQHQEVLDKVGEVIASDLETRPLVEETHTVAHEIKHEVQAAKEVADKPKE